ncbi:hypothetical protein I5U65_02335 [Stenotrophomonas maltophilia]|nr:hypothetical protein [Stenotrophomonas maltophilia]
MKEELWFVAECEDLVDNSHYRVWVHRSGSSARLTVAGTGRRVPVDAKTQDEAVAQILIKLQMSVEKILSRAEVARATNKHLLQDVGEASSDSEADDSEQIIDEESEEPSESTPQQQSSAPLIPFGKPGPLVSLIARALLTGGRAGLLQRSSAQLPKRTTALW